MGESVVSNEKKLQGEKAWLDARQILSDLGFVLQQIDWLGKRDGKWTKFEVKAQEAFTPPPFKGHGLPRWQVKNSMELLEEKDIRTYLMIWDIEENKWLGAYLDELEKGNYHDTFGYKPRRIYPIENFNIIGEDLM